MHVTVLICTRNRAAVLAEALASHPAVEMPAGVVRDMVVVDNGSTDGTAEVVAAFRKSAPFDVAYVREDREGHSVALNTGCRVATGDVVAFTDDDAFPAEGWLTAIHETFVRRDADWVYGPVVPRWETGRAPAWYGPATAPLVACLDYGPREFVATDPGQTFYGVNHAARRDRLFELGLYREDLGIRPGRGSVAGNDDDLFARALRAGFRLVYDPRASVRHFIPAARCRKRTHRRNTRRVAVNQFHRLLEQPPAPPTLIGLPRFYFRKPIEHVSGWVRGLVNGDASRRFFNEVQLIRFLTIIGRAGRHRLFGGGTAP